MTDSFESRLREMAADRLLDAVQFAHNGEGRATPQPGSSTSLLLSMAETLRACMRDWPSSVDVGDGESARFDALERFKSTLKDARRMSRSSTDDTLVFVLAEALYVMAEQWPTARDAAVDLPATFPQTSRASLPTAINGHPQNKVRSPVSSISDVSFPSASRVAAAAAVDPDVIHGAFAPEPEQDESICSTDLNGMSGNAALDALLARTIKTERRESIEEDDSWSIANPSAIVAAFAAAASPVLREGSVASSRKPSMEKGRDEKRARIFRFHCPECGLGCVARTQLEAHMNIHTGARPFECKYCAKSYKRKDHLTDHLKKSHPDKYRSARQQREIDKAELIQKAVEALSK